MIVAFCGHRRMDNKKETERWLVKTCGQLIAEGADTFYLGGYGEFDALAAQIARKLRTNHGGLKVVLVIPYLNRNADTAGYNEIVYPPLEAVPLRFAISRRNEWMVEQADVVVSYVTHDWGGAYKTMEYARKKHKRIINYSSICREKEDRYDNGDGSL